MPQKKVNWITSRAAAAILTENSGHTISEAYVRRLGLSGKLGFMELDGRTKLYSEEDVKAYTVKKKGNGDVRRAAREKEAKEAA